MPPSLRNNPVPETGVEASGTSSPDFEDHHLENAASVVVTDELREAVLNALSKLGGSKGNQALREELGWDDATYSAVKNDLVGRGKLVPGKGRGGSVSLPTS